MRSDFFTPRAMKRDMAKMLITAPDTPMLLEATIGQIPERRPNSSSACEGQIAAPIQVQTNSSA